MKYNQNGITFESDDLREVPLCDLDAQTISRAHIFYLLGSQKKPMLLLRAGDFIEQSFISQYLDRGMSSVFLLDLVDDESLSIYRNLWSELKHAEIESEKLKIRDKFILSLTKDFYQNNEKCYLNFQISCFEEFNIYSNHVVDQIQDISMVLYSRSLLVSSLSVIAGLTNHYVDYHFLKDLYNVCFILDYGLVDFNYYNYTMGMACEKERNNPGDGIKFLLKLNRPKSEQDAFLSHPIKSFKTAKGKKGNFTNPELIEVIKYQHEQADGSGFPQGIVYSAMTDFETLISFCDYLVPFSEHHFRAGDGNQILFELISQLKATDSYAKLPIKKIVRNWDAIFSWAIDKNLQESSETQLLNLDEELAG